MDPTDLQRRIRAFYADLERLEARHADLTEPDVVEALHATLNLHLVWGRPVAKLPATFFLFARSGDRELRRLVDGLLRDVLPVLEEAGIPPGAERLALLQDDALTTSSGHRYDRYLGSTDRPRPAKALPEAMYRNPRGRELGWAALVTAVLLLLLGWLLARLPGP